MIWEAQQEHAEEQEDPGVEVDQLFGEAEFADAVGEERMMEELAEDLQGFFD